MIHDSSSIWYSPMLGRWKIATTVPAGEELNTYGTCRIVWLRKRRVVCRSFYLGLNCCLVQKPFSCGDAMLLLLSKGRGLCNFTKQPCILRLHIDEMRIPQDRVQGKCPPNPSQCQREQLQQPACPQRHK